MKVPLNAIALCRCVQIERRWNRCTVSIGSPVATVIHCPNSLMNSRPAVFTDTARLLCRNFMPKFHRQLWVKDLPKVPTWRLERESSPWPFGRKVLTLPKRHHIPQIYIYECKINFINEWMNIWLIDTCLQPEISYYAGLLHDAVVFWAYAVNESIKANRVNGFVKEEVPDFFSKPAFTGRAWFRLELSS